jgi:hypothetical protein
MPGGPTPRTAAATHSSTDLLDRLAQVASQQFTKSAGPILNSALILGGAGAGALAGNRPMDPSAPDKGPSSGERTMRGAITGGAAGLGASLAHKSQFLRGKLGVGAMALGAFGGGLVGDRVADLATAKSERQRALRETKEQEGPQLARPLPYYAVSSPAAIPTALGRRSQATQHPAQRES